MQLVTSKIDSAFRAVLAQPIRHPLAHHAKVLVDSEAEAPRHQFPEPRLFDYDRNGRVDASDVIQEKQVRSKIQEIASQSKREQDDADSKRHEQKEKDAAAVEVEKTEQPEENVSQEPGHISVTA